MSHFFITTVKMGSYCPVCKGTALADCYHSKEEFEQIGRPTVVGTVNTYFGKEDCSKLYTTWRPIEESKDWNKPFLAVGRYSIHPVTVERQVISRKIIPVWDGSRVIESETDFGTTYVEADPFTHCMPLPEPPEWTDD